MLLPPPSTIGSKISCSSSTRSAAIRARTTAELPRTVMSPPERSRIADTSATRLAGRMMVVGVHAAVSASVKVSETTYF